MFISVIFLCLFIVEVQANQNNFKLTKHLLLVYINFWNGIKKAKKKIFLGVN